MLYFEQISGSEEFKRPYNAARQAAEEAEAKAIALHNTKTTIKKEMRITKKEKQEAEAYQSKKDEHARAQTQLVLWRLFQNKELTTDKQEDVDLAVQEFDLRSKDYDAKADLLDREKKEYYALRLEEGRAEKSLETVRAALDKLEPASIELSEKVSRGGALIANAHAEVSQAQNALQRHKRELAAANAAIEELEQNYTQMVASQAARRVGETASQLPEDADDSPSSSSSASATSAGEEAMQLAMSLVGDGEHASEYESLDRAFRARTLEDRQSLESYERQAAASRMRLERMDSELAELNGPRQVRLRAALLQDRERIAANREASALAVKDIEEKTLLLEQLQQTLEQRTQELTVLRERATKAEQAYSVARAGSRHSAREEKHFEAVEQLQHFFPGVKGRLSQLCEPTQARFRVATSLAMGRTMDAVVVDTKETAIKCINYLREHRMGVAEFIPLDNVHVPNINEKYRDLSGSYKLALDCLHFADAYYSAVAYAVGDAMVCDNWQTAKKLRYVRKWRLKCITLDGEVIHKNSNITGGLSKEQGAGHSGRWNDKLVTQAKKKRDALANQVKLMEREIRTGVILGNVSAENDGVNDEDAQMDDSDSDSDDDGVAVRRGLAKSRKSTYYATKSTETVRQRKEAFETAIKSARGRIEYLESEIPRIEKQAKGTLADLTTLESRAAVLQPERDDEAKRLATLDSSMSTLRQQIHSIETDMFDPLSRELGTTVGKLRAMQRDAAESDRARQSETAKLREKIMRLKQERDLKAKRDPSSQVTTAQEWLDEQTRKLEQDRKQAKKIEKKVAAKETQVASAVAELRTVSERVAIAAETFKAAQKARESVLRQRKRAEKTLTQVKQQLEQLRVECHDLHQKARLDAVSVPKKEDRSDTGVTSSSSSSLSGAKDAKKKNSKNKQTGKRKGRDSKGRKNKISSSLGSQATGTDFSSSEGDRSELEDSSDESPSVASSSLSSAAGGSSSRSGSSSNLTGASSLTGAFESSQSKVVRRDVESSELVDFSKMDKDIMKEWKKKRAALGKKMAKIAAKAKKDRAAAGEGADKVVGDSGAVKSARTSAEIRTFCNKTTTDLEARVQKITSELEEMQPNSRANEDHQTLKDRFDGVTKELSIAKEQSRTRAKVSGIRKLSVGQI